MHAHLHTMPSFLSSWAHVQLEGSRAHQEAQLREAREAALRAASDVAVYEAQHDSNASRVAELQVGTGQDNPPPTAANNSSSSRARAIQLLLLLPVLEGGCCYCCCVPYTAGHTYLQACHASTGLDGSCPLLRLLREAGGGGARCPLLEGARSPSLPTYLHLPNCYCWVPHTCSYHACMHP